MPISLPGCVEGFGLTLPARRGLCVIISDFGIGHDGFITRRHGTGFLFHSEGRHSYVLTAGHNIYHHDLGRFARDAGLWFGRSGDAEDARRKMRQARVPDAFEAASHPAPRFDYGVMQVTLLEADRFVPFGLTKDAPAGRAARMPGYPNEGAAQGSFRPFHADLDLSIAGADNFGYPAAQQTYAGQSGAPLLLPRDGQVPEACGLHIRGPGIAERALRFTGAVFDQLAAWV